MPAPVLIDSERGIRLCFPKLEDGTEVYEGVRESIPEISPWMGWCHPGYQLEETELWIRQLPDQWKARNHFVFLIRDREGRFVGTCGLSHPNWLHRLANLGYWIRTSATGNGYATAAAQLVASWGFRELELTRIEIMMAVGNRGSLRVAEKAGAVHEGVLRSRLHVAGKILDAHCFSLVPADVAPSRHHGA